MKSSLRRKRPDKNRANDYLTETRKPEPVDSMRIWCYDYHNNVIATLRRCVEVHGSRVVIWTDKAGRRIVKGAYAEEKYLLMDILSGCAVKNCMSVTDKGFHNGNQVECYGKKKEYASLALPAERLFISRNFRKF